METMTTIRQRKSTRAYKSDQIPKDTLDLLLMAGCAAPVGKAQYDSLQLTVVQKEEILKEISQKTAQLLKIDTNPLYNAPTLVIVSATEKQLFPNIEYANAACVTENILLAATDNKIDSVFLWGPAVAINADPELKKILGIPEENKVICSAALGYATDPNMTKKELSIKIPINWAV